MITIAPDSMGLDQVISCNIPKKVLKTAITEGRVIQPYEKDFCFTSPHRDTEQPKAGFVWTKEGLVKFSQGDILCRGVECELWPMNPREFFEIKIRHPEYPTNDEEGWGKFINFKPVFAIKMDQGFKVQIWDGSLIEAEAGDYLLYSEDRKTVWPCANSIFNASYISAK